MCLYPKSDTPGGPTESCEFRDSHSAFARTDTVVLGISPDPAYGVWVEKSRYGKNYMGGERAIFLITPDGEIKKIGRKVKPAGHATEVLAAL